MPLPLSWPLAASSVKWANSTALRGWEDPSQLASAQGCGRMFSRQRCTCSGLPGGPVARPLCFRCRGPHVRFSPSSGNQGPASCAAQPKNKIQLLLLLQLFLILWSKGESSLRKTKVMWRESLPACMSLDLGKLHGLSCPGSSCVPRRAYTAAPLSPAASVAESCSPQPRVRGCPVRPDGDGRPHGPSHNLRALGR